MSTSSSTIACLDGLCCPAACTSKCDDGRDVESAGLDVIVGLAADVLGVVGFDGGVEAEISSSVTFCWEKREEADDE